MHEVSNKLRVCHYPQVPCKPFIVEVANENEAKLVSDTLANQHLWLYKHKFIPDYCNVISVEMWDENFDEWCEYFNSVTGMEFDEFAERYLKKDNQIKEATYVNPFAGCFTVR